LGKCGEDSRITTGWGHERLVWEKDWLIRVWVPPYGEFQGIIIIFRIIQLLDEMIAGIFSGDNIGCFLIPPRGRSCNSQTVKKLKIVRNGKQDKTTNIEILMTPYQETRSMISGSSPGPLVAIDKKVRKADMSLGSSLSIASSSSESQTVSASPNTCLAKGDPNIALLFSVQVSYRCGSVVKVVWAGLISSLI
jgi:hypothetical protein